ncbi:hypothetical protein DDN60_17475 [Vibrio cholerae]|nr:hypothetical protein [Vibrio cholerae]
MASGVTPNIVKELRSIAQDTIRNKYLRLNGSKMWQTGGTIESDIGCNCLPAHLAILGRVKEMELGIAPAVVIGCLLPLGEELSERSKEKIYNNVFLGDDPHQEYHAWIALDKDDIDSDIIDITGSLYYGLTIPEMYINKAIARRVNRKYHPIITNEDEIYSYHANLVYAQIKAESQVPKNSEVIWYLTGFSQIQGANVSAVQALGFRGNKLLNDGIKNENSASVNGWRSAFNNLISMMKMR